MAPESMLLVELEEEAPQLATAASLPALDDEREACQESSEDSPARRGKKACAECHERKLRCNVAETGDDACTPCKEHNRVCSLRVEKKRGRPSKVESPPMKASPLHLMSVASVHFGSPTQIAKCISGSASSPLGSAAALSAQCVPRSTLGSMLAMPAMALTPAAAAAAAAAETGAASPQSAGAAPMATVAVAATSQQLGTHRPLLVLPDGAAGFDNGAFAQRPAMPAGPVAQSAAAASAALSAQGEAAARGEAWMRQSSQLPQRFNGPMFVTDAVSGKMVPIAPMRGGGPHIGGAGAGDSQAATPMMMMASGQAGAAQMMYCGLPAPMVSMAPPPPTPVRVVCRGCGLVRMEVEGAPLQQQQ